MHRTPIRTTLSALAMLIASSAYGADAAKVVPLLNQPLADLPSKEAAMLTVAYGPGESSPVHRHNADVFVYVLEGAVIMGVNGDKPVRIEAGQTFHESPSDVHSVSRNASDSAPAKFLVFFVKNKGAPPTTPAQ
jgi:quercetin dioxygenase-like cupin family protein